MSKVLDSKEIGWRLRTIRQQVGMTQEKLAEQVGVTTQQVQKYESGADKMNTDRLQQVANALSIPVQALFMGVEEAVPLSVAEKLLVESYREIDDKELQKCLLKFATAAAKK